MVNLRHQTKKDWHGKWIWANYVEQIQNADPQVQKTYNPKDFMNNYVLFRHNLQIKSGLKKAILNISVDSRYKLFINGNYVGRGINRCESQFWYYNQYDISQHLKPGLNIIAVHARYYGRELAYYDLPEPNKVGRISGGKGGLLFDGILEYAENSSNSKKKSIEYFGSDISTKVKRDLAEEQNTPWKGGLGFTQIFDSQLLEQNWNECDFADSEWENATIYSYPIKTLILDDNAPLMEQIYYPNQILHIGEFEDSFNDMDDDEKQEIDFIVQHILDDQIESDMHTQVIDKESLLQEEGICVINPPESGKSISIMLQFPKEMVGYPRLMVEGSPGTIIDILTCEKLRSGQLYMDFNSKRGSRFILRGNKQFYEQWDWEGFLFVQLKIRNMKEPLKIYSISANQTHMRINSEKQGMFECSDPELNAIWEACAYTLLCCSVDGYLDCPQREQRSYLGDAYVEALVSNVCFGEPRLTKKLLLDAAFGQRQDGMTYSFHPGDYLDPTHILVDYALYWIQIAWDYWQYYGDKELLMELYPQFLRVIDWFMVYLDPKTDLLHNIPYGFFIDWAYNGPKPDYNGIINAQFYDCLKIVVKIAQMRNDEYIISKFSPLIKKMKIHLANDFWDENQGCYRDAFDGSKAFWLLSQHTNSYFSLKGITPKDKISRIITRIFDHAPIDLEDEFLSPNRPPKGDYIKKNIDFDEYILYAMPFFMHYVHKFLAENNRYDLILRYIKKGWGPMLKLGKTHTIWETFAQVQSECHAWSTTPAFDLSTYWLGIKPAEPGFKKLLIAPTFYGLDWVKGIYPTCRGNIKVSWEKLTEKDQQTHIHIELEIPALIESIEFRIPQFDDRDPIQVSLNSNIIDSVGSVLSLESISEIPTIIDIIY